MFEIVASNIQLSSLTTFVGLHLAEKFAFAPGLAGDVKKSNLVSASIFVLVFILFFFKKIVCRWLE